MIVWGTSFYQRPNVTRDATAGCLEAPSFCLADDFFQCFWEVRLGAPLGGVSLFNGHPIDNRAEKWSSWEDIVFPPDISQRNIHSPKTKFK
jgi:hypothetical protein